LGRTIATLACALVLLGPLPPPPAGGTPAPNGATPAGFALGWGDNQFGQLGDGTTTNRTSPTRVAGNLTGIIAVAEGDGHTLALGAGGRVLAWGLNRFGQLGDGTTTDHNSPVPITSVTDFRAIAAGQYHSLALEANGTVYAWGRNGEGELGDTTT